MVTASRSATTSSATTSAELRVVLADENAAMRRSLRRVLEASPGIRVVGEALDLDDIDEQLRDLTPDVVVLDLRLPGGSVHDSIRACTAAKPPVRVIGTTMSRNSVRAAEALRAGAEAVVLKDRADEELAAAVEAPGAPPG